MGSARVCVFLLLFLYWINKLLSFYIACDRIIEGSAFWMNDWKWCKSVIGDQLARSKYFGFEKGILFGFQPLGLIVILLHNQQSTIIITHSKEKKAPTGKNNADSTLSRAFVFGISPQSKYLLFFRFLIFFVRFVRISISNATAHRVLNS